MNNNLFHRISIIALCLLNSLPTKASYPDQWSTQSTTAYINTTEYINGHFYALGDLRLMRSKDGITWNNIPNLNLYALFTGLAYGNNRYIMSTSFGNFMQSTDGISWFGVSPVNVRPLGSQTYIPSNNIDFSNSVMVSNLAFGAGVFVVTGNDGELWVSTDGSHWDQVASPTNNPFYRIEYVNGEFFALGQLGEIAKSSDGYNWILISARPGAKLHDISYANDLYVIGTEAGAGSILTSTDGLSWSSILNNTLNCRVRAVEWDGSDFIAVTQGCGIWSSPSGIDSWTQIAPLHPNNNLMDLAIGNRSYVAAFTYSRFGLSVPGAHEIYDSTLIIAKHDSAIKNDFDGNKRSDGLWRNTTNGQTQVSISNAQGNIDRIEYQWKLRDSDWIAEGNEDFNGDGFTDTLWRNALSGQTQVSISDAQGNIDRIEYQWKLRDNDWIAEGNADFNGDGFTDTLWRNTVSGQTQVSISSAQGNIDHIEYQWKLRNSDWIAEGIADFNSDGFADVLWRNTVSGQTQVSISNAQGNIAHIEYQWKVRDTDWSAEGLGDFNGDGFVDILWRNTLSGLTQVSISNAQGNIDHIEYQWKLRDSTWNAEGVDDFNGDGLDDTLWRNTVSGQTQVSVSNSLGNIDRIEYQWKLRNTEWRAEGIADFNGDGLADTLWRNTTNGNTQVNISNNSGNIERIEYQWKPRDMNWQFLQ